MNNDFYTLENHSPSRGKLGQSTYDRDYTPKRAERSAENGDGFGHAMKDRMLTTQEFLNMDKNPEKMNDETVYKQDYDKKPLQKSKNFSPQRTYSPSGKFRGETTNQHDYDRKPLPERSSHQKE